MLYEYLKSNYSSGEPIFANDIFIPGMTEALSVSFEEIDRRRNFVSL